ncbi:MAG: DNA internalization-related competence protein ComEC/Rec2, partial [Syntrophales bacterium]|nr:DNA internalization-related competence protein ComEC/Rec2 [Syntrophales bacterium]
LRDMYNTVAFAGLVILVINPYALFDISFQLSFVGLLSIIFITPRLLSLFPSPPSHPPLLHRVLAQLRSFIAVTVAASLGTMPLIIFHFHRVSVIALAANLVVVPILGILAIPLGMAVVFIAPFSSILALPFLHAAGFLADGSIALVRFFASVPYGSTWVSAPRLWEIIVAYVFIFAVVRLIEIRGTPHGQVRKVYIIVACFAALTLFVNSLYVEYKARNRGIMTVTAIDVGQGASALVVGPHGGALLIDGGGFYDDRFDIGRYVVAPYLRQKGISTLEAVVLTHPHPDHFAGLTYILEHFTVRSFWTNGHRTEGEPFARLMETVARKAIPVEALHEGSAPREIDGISIRVFNPSALRLAEDANDASLVTLFTFRGTEVLFCGDISAAVEERIITNHPEVRATVLFVPHHGSRHATSPKFLDTVRPRIAVVSAGRANVFGLPHPETIRRLRQRGIAIYRTDLHGAITLDIHDDERITVRHFRLP